MNGKSKASGAILYVSLLAFISFVVYVIYANQEVLYTAHDRSEFLFGAPFFHTLLSKPFGLMQYVGAWLTQLFFHPALGTGVLLAIWALIFCVGVKAFRLQGSASALMLLPVACLLTSVIDLGYWIYIFSIRGYWFSQSVGYLVMLLLLWAARCTPRKWHLAWYLLGVCLYPVLGWFALLFILCLLLAEKPSWRELVGLVLLFLAAYIWRVLLFSDQNPDDTLMAGFPRFVTPVESSGRLAIPFCVLAVVSVLIPLCGRFLNKAFVPVLCAVAGIAFTYSLMFRDKNYIDEMRMVRHAEADNWQEVLHVAEENKQPTHTMVMLKNIALMNEGGLLDRSFKLSNHGVDVSNPDSLHIGLLNIASPLVYYNYGKINYAIRLCYENAVATGFSPFYMKMISRCARATGEEKLAERYITLLHHNMFYGNWQPAPITKTVSELQKSFSDEINGVENNSERYIIDSFSHATDTISKAVSEQALFYSMIRRDSRCFWASLRKYVKLHPNDKFPLHAQEAYIMFMDKSPEEKRMMLPVEQPIFERYKKFGEALENHIRRGLQREEIGAAMQGEWADTYWWYNIFGISAQ
jgi:hypothetical protein